MKLLVTGATGFIGNHVVDRLLLGGHELLVATTKPERVQRDWQVQTVAFQDNHGGLDESAITQFAPDALLHLAWAGIPNLDVNWSLTNVAIATRVFATALACGVKRIVGLGSCREYQPGGGRKCESDLPKHNTDVFGQAKTSTRDLLRVAAEDRGVEWRWGLPFFVYGTGQRHDSLIPAAIAKAAMGSELNVSSPRAAVDFINVIDVAEALFLLTTGPGPSGAFNIGSGRAHNVASVAAWVAKEWRGQESGQILPGSEPDAWWADHTSISEGYGWAPTIALESGIRDVIGRWRG